MELIHGKVYDIYVLDTPVKAVYYYEYAQVDVDLLQPFSKSKEPIWEQKSNFTVYKRCFRLGNGTIIDTKDVYLYKEESAIEYNVNTDVASFMHSHRFYSLKGYNKPTVFEYKTRKNHFIRFQIEIINNIELRYTVEYHSKLEQINKSYSKNFNVVDIYDTAKTFSIQIFLEVGEILAKQMGDENILPYEFVMNEIRFSL